MRDLERDGRIDQIRDLAERGRRSSRLRRQTRHLEHLPSASKALPLLRAALASPVRPSSPHLWPLSLVGLSSNFYLHDESTHLHSFIFHGVHALPRSLAKALACPLHRRIAPVSRVVISEAGLLSVSNLAQSGLRGLERLLLGQRAENLRMSGMGNIDAGQMEPPSWLEGILVRR